MLGRTPGRAFRTRRYLELGFGQGFGLSLLAAANPDIIFEGIDFNPEHVAHARRLIADAGLKNVTVEEASFEEAAARQGDNDLDVVALHGIFSWISRSGQDAVVDIMRRRLQPDGVTYISYNCMPGWAVLAPLRQLMLEVKRRNAGGSERQLFLALDLLKKLKAGGAGYFSVNPSAGDQLDVILQMDPVYLAHEYLDEHWDLFQFSEVASRLGDAKLTFLASATLPENVDAYAVPETLRPLVADASDAVFRETLKDYAANKRFRRDIFARGATSLTPSEHRRYLSHFGFVASVPRSRMVFRFAGPLSTLTGRDDLYAPIADRLATGPVAFDELVALPAFGETQLGVLLDCLGLLIHSGQVLPVADTDGFDPEPARRFNRVVVDNARAGRLYFSLAAPSARTGIPVNDFGLLTLAALAEGYEDPRAAAKYALRIVRDAGRYPVREGKTIEDEGEATAFLEQNIRLSQEEMVPIWRRLGVI